MTVFFLLQLLEEDQMFPSQTANQRHHGRFPQHRYDEQLHEANGANRKVPDADFSLQCKNEYLQ